MSDTELLKEIRDLLRIMAEPQIAQRDAKLRKELVVIVGSGKKQREAVLLMDGSRTQKEIINVCGIDSGQLSRLVKVLEGKGLVEKRGGNPATTIQLPSNFFEEAK